MRNIRAIMCAAGMTVTLAWVGIVRAEQPAITIPEHRTGAEYNMPFYTGTITPTPKQVQYSESFSSLARTGILLGTGISQDDPRCRMLAERIIRYGGVVTIIDSLDGDYDAFVSIGETSAATLAGTITPPEHAEGYCIHSTETNGKPVFVLRGRDKLGEMWAAVSFVQLIQQKDNAPFVQKAEVSDFPDGKGRGFITNSWSGSGSQWAWYALNFKINRVEFSPKLYVRPLSSRIAQPYWRDPNYYTEQWKKELQHIADIFNPVGIDWYVYIAPIRGEAEQKIDCKSEKDFQAVMTFCRPVAAAGGNIHILFDDTRFPISPADQKNFGSAREADIYFLNKLYSAIKAEYPKVKMVFCPPFYWGPTSPAAYPESREEYLAALGERLPKDMEIYWTGNRVKSTAIEKSYVQWISKLIQRKPVLWQNAYGHCHGGIYYHYAADPIPAWKEWYYDSFFDEIGSYQLNCNMPTNGPAVVTLSDYLWNRKAYDPDRSIREAVSKLVGPETWPAMVRLTETLKFFDDFGLSVSPGAAKRNAEIQEKIKETKSVLDETMAYHPEAVKAWTAMGIYVDKFATFARRVASNKNLSKFTQAVELLQAVATKEAGFSPKKDIFLSPYDFLGGSSTTEYACRCEKRLATWIYDAKSSNSKMTAKFQIEPFPPSGDYALILSAQDDDTEKQSRIRITVNGKTIFEGENPFVRFGWSRHTFTIPVKDLERYNTLEIANIEESSPPDGRSWFMLNYAIARKTTD